MNVIASVVGGKSRLGRLASAIFTKDEFGALVGPIVMDIDGAALQARFDEIVSRVEEIEAKASDDERDLTEEELIEVENLGGEADKVKRRMAAIANLAPPPSAGRRAAADVENRGDRGQRGKDSVVPANPRNRDDRGGFKSFGEFAQKVQSAVRDPGNVDQRISNAATTYGNEGVGADGGFAVPPEFRREIWKKVMEEENLLARCAELVTGGNNLTIPKDETTPWQTSGGVQVYWENEAGQIGQTKPQLEMTTIRLAKLTALVPLSDEVLEDAPGLESWLRAKAPGKMASKINSAIVDGNGVGKPLGILRAGSLISVAKETSQPADSIFYANIVKIWSRMYAPCRRNAVWLINQDIEPQLYQMAFDPDATAGKVPVYLPPGGASGSPYGTLMGRPVVPIEACKTLGDKGDIILADLSQYWALRKSGQDIRTDVSMHLYFDQALTAFRFIFRVNGQPAWGAVIAPENGSMTRSWAVTLDERS